MTDRCDCGSKVGEPHLPACHYTGIVTAISRYNVADMQGNLIDDRVIDGQANMPLPDEPWDLRDEDGDRHSPAWYLDAWLVSRDEYHRAVNQPDPNIQECDDALIELDMYAKYVNKLFGYSGE